MSTRLSTDAILIAVKNMVGKKHKTFPAKHLDIGSGDGRFIAMLAAEYEIQSHACDYTNELIKDADVTVDIVNLNDEKLPYKSNEFDIITAIEVIEHLENYRKVIRESFRILKDGGTIIITTPNILNLKSRIRYLIFGFFNLFGPLRFKNTELYTTGGHITPIGVFYLVHSLIDAGFYDIEVKIDKRQATSICWAIFFFLPIKALMLGIINKEIRKYKTIDENNKPYVLIMNTFDILVGRTIVVGAKK